MENLLFLGVPILKHIRACFNMAGAWLIQVLYTANAALGFWPFKTGSWLMRAVFKTNLSVYC